MPQPSYAYAAGRIFSLENKLLSRERIERMVDAPSAGDAIKILAETEYSTQLAEIAGPHDYEKLLSGEIQRIYTLIQSISPEPEITALFFLKYDFHNLKVLLKARYLEREHPDLLVETGTLPLSLLQTAIKDKDYRALPPFIEKVLQKIDDLMILRVDPRKIVLMLDEAMYQHIFNVCHRNKNEFVLDYFTKQVDLINIRSFIRVRKMNETYDFLKENLLPYGKLDTSFFENYMDEPLEKWADEKKLPEYEFVIQQGVQSFIKTDTLTVFERLMDDFLLNYIRALRWNPLGLEPIVGYLLAKENEVRLIRMVMVGKINNLPAATIRERLRDVYV